MPVIYGMRLVGKCHQDTAITDKLMTGENRGIYPYNGAKAPWPIWGYVFKIYYSDLWYV